MMDVSRYLREEFLPAGREPDASAVWARNAPTVTLPNAIHPRSNLAQARSGKRSSMTPRVAVKSVRRVRMAFVRGSCGSRVL